MQTDFCDRMRAQLEAAYKKRDEIEREIDSFKSGKLPVDAQGRVPPLAQLVDAWDRRFRANQVDIDVLSQIVEACGKR